MRRELDGNTFSLSNIWSIFKNSLSLQRDKAFFIWLYVGFMCHQVIEKAIKAHWSAVKPDETPFIHNLVKLAQSCGLAQKMTQEQLRFIAALMPMNIEARYPSYKEELSRTLTQEYCRQLIDNTKTMKLWIESMH